MRIKIKEYKIGKETIKVLGTPFQSNNGMELNSLEEIYKFKEDKSFKIVFLEDLSELFIGFKEHTTENLYLIGRFSADRFGLEDSRTLSYKRLKELDKELNIKQGEWINEKVTDAAIRKIINKLIEWGWNK